MARRRVLALLALPAALSLSVLLAAPAAAAPRQEAGTGSATVGLSSDAWYSTSPACTASPTGCLPAAAPNTYPAKTLHVGVTAGQEDSRSYLALDLAGLPASTTLVGGTLRLPVSADADGTRAADSAKLQACLVTASFKDNVEGSAEVAPAVDCKKATSAANYVPASGPVPAAFVIDLAPLAAAWSAGAANQGVAILPAGGGSPTDAWHVAFSAHDRQVAAPQRVTALVSYTTVSAITQNTTFDAAPSDSQAAPPPDSGSFGSSSVLFAAPPLASVNAPAAATQPLVPAPQAQAAPVAAAQLQPQAFSLPGSGYSYPGVFLLPLLLAVAGGWVARVLTRDLTPRLAHIA